MTREHIEQLNKYNKTRGEETKQAVLNVIALGGDTPITPDLIKKDLDVKALSEISKQYQQGKISSQDFENKLKDKTVDIRTVHRHLAELTREKLVDKKGSGKYVLSIKAKSDMRYFAREFGTFELFCLMNNFFPDQNNIEQNISNLIKIFGIYVVFCFMEASRPTSGDIASSASMDAYTMHGLISRYLDNVFPVDTMYDYFLGIMKYIFDKHENKEQEYISLSQELNKLAEDKQLHAPSNGDNKVRHQISGVEIFRALQTMRMKHIEQHTGTIKQSRYYDERQRREQQDDLRLKETIRLFYELDQATVKSLQSELGKMADAKTYDRLNIEREIENALAGALNIDKTDISKLEKLKSDIERSKPKNKALLSMIENVQNYFGKNNNKSKRISSV